MGVKGTTVWVPVEIRDKLKDLRTYYSEPLWVVVNRLIEKDKCKARN